MAEPKPLASLTAGLLARRGGAQPAMRRPVPGLGRASAVAVQQDDLGWNDMGSDDPVTSEAVEARPDAGPMPMTPDTYVQESAPVPPVVTAREELAERLGLGRTARTDAAAGRKAAFTLRLDAERHLKLRLACAIHGRSAQQIVTQAIDIFLNGLPEIDRMAQQLPRKSAGK